MPAKTVLVVDDEQDIVELVGYNLEKEGFSVIRAYDGEKALEYVRTKKPDLLVLDLMLPGLTGLDVCKMLRGKAETASLPIIMLTAKGNEIDKVVGLEMGADDYITKPFHIREFVARVKSVLRRSELRDDGEKRKIYHERGLYIDYQSYEVSVNGREADLGPTEMKLLIFLSQHSGRVYSRDQLLERVWGDESFVEPRTVDVHISRLRSAIEVDKENPEYILTVRGIGYKFSDSRRDG